MIDIDDYKALRAWQAANRRTLYVYGGAIVVAVLIPNLHVFFRG